MIMLISVALQVYDILHSARPILRPAPKAPERQSPLWYKFLEPEAMNTERIVYV